MSKCEGCKQDEEQRKRLEEMMKKRVKSQDCPYKNECTQKVLKDEAEIMCKDKEKSQEAVMIHMNGKHVWMLCSKFNDIRREKEGKLPKDW